MLYIEDSRVPIEGGCKPTDPQKGSWFIVGYCNGLLIPCAQAKEPEPRRKDVELSVGSRHDLTEINWSGHVMPLEQALDSIVVSFCQTVAALYQLAIVGIRLYSVPRPLL